MKLGKSALDNWGHLTVKSYLPMGLKGDFGDKKYLIIGKERAEPTNSVRGYLARRRTVR